MLYYALSSHLALLILTLNNISRYIKISKYDIIYYYYILLLLLWLLFSCKGWGLENYWEDAFSSFLLVDCVALQPPLLVTHLPFVSSIFSQTPNGGYLQKALWRSSQQKGSTLGCQSTVDNDVHVSWNVSYLYYLWWAFLVGSG